MKDCRLTITVRNDDIRCEMENISMVELATLSGYLQMLVGQEAIARGVDIEEVKTNLLDVHLESMITQEMGMVRQEGSHRACRDLPVPRVMPGSDAWHDAVPEAAY